MLAGLVTMVPAAAVAAATAAAIVPVDPIFAALETSSDT
jgi:hypothetical protein